ncbi:MAG: ABC transporter ATP-binding protein [Candidatus Aquicultorales bacterium]
MAQAVVSTSSLTKYYGKQRGVVDLDIEILPGEVFGYLGPNGAGKTTTIRMLLDFIRPTRGDARVFGLDSHIHSQQIREDTGYLPGELMLYEKLTGLDTLRYFANLRGGVDWAFVQKLADRLDYDLSKHVRTLSRGNKQKLGLIQAFMHRPKLLILDEPTSGLDPLMQQEFYRLIKEVRGEGRTVLLSSHVMPEVEHICDRVGIIREGRLIAVKQIEELKAAALRRLEIHFAGPVPKEAFEGLPGVRDVMVENGTLRCAAVGSLDAVIKAAAKFEVVNVVSQEPSLEDIFLTYYSGGEDLVEQRSS